MRKLVQGIREAISPSAANAQVDTKRLMGKGSSQVGVRPFSTARVCVRRNRRAVTTMASDMLTAALVVVFATTANLADLSSTAHAQYVGPYNSCHREDIGTQACINGLTLTCVPGQDSDSDGVWENQGYGSCKPSGSDATGTVCLAAAYRPSEDQGGGVFPKYVYVSSPFNTQASVGSFIQYVRQTYGYASNGTPDLNIYKWDCSTGDTNSITQSFMDGVRQDGGTASVNEVPTGWSP